MPFLAAAVFKSAIASITYGTETPKTAAANLVVGVTRIPPSRHLAAKRARSRASHDFILEMELPEMTRTGVIAGEAVKLSDQ